VLSFTLKHEVTTPSRSGDKTCRVFAWIGQSFEFCDTCGKAYWENHLYEFPFGGTKGQLRVKVYKSWRDEWTWEAVNVITREQAERVREKWGGYYEQAIFQSKYDRYSV